MHFPSPKKSATNLLETRSAETDGCLQELGTETGVLPDGVSDFVDAGSGSFTDGGKSVDGGDSLRVKGSQQW